MNDRLNPINIEKRRLTISFTWIHFFIVQAVFLAILIYRTVSKNIYPAPPLMYNSNDTFMDFFNTCYWTLQEQDTYVLWRSIYPPFAHLLCYFSYIFVEFDKSLTPLSQSGISASWRYSLLFSMPYIFMCLIYLYSIFLLTFTKCKAILGNKLCFLLFFSLSLIIPNLFLFERGNILIYSIALINFSFVLSGQKMNTNKREYIRAILISAAFSIKPYLLLLLILFRKLNYIFIFVITSIILNVAALMIWQPRKPENLFKNVIDFSSVTSLNYFVERCYYSFSLMLYKLQLELARLFLPTYQKNIGVFALFILIGISTSLLLYNTYIFIKFYFNYRNLVTNDFLVFVTYTFCLYLVSALLLDSAGYIMAFFIPSIILFIFYFPRTRFNLWEFIVICYVFVYIPFLPDNLYRINFASSYLSDLFNIPLKTLIPTFTVDPIIRPLVLQLLAFIFFTRIFSEVKQSIEGKSGNSIEPSYAKFN